MKKIGILGSLNVDLTVTMPRFHLPGETITGTGFHTFTGGKGGNQAVAAAKLDVPTLMVGKLGDDQYGELYRTTMRNLKIEQDTVLTEAGLPSGVALIEVDERSENRIVVVPGANGAVDMAQVERVWPELLACDMVLMQLEIPMETVIYAAQKLHMAGKTVILDPAPAVPLQDRLLAAVDYVTPNETELCILTGMPTGTDDEVAAAARTLLDRGVKTVIAKLGARGAMIVTTNGQQMVPGFKVKAIDTTAAGDSFNAGFAAALLDGKAPADAVRFACAVAAISTTAMGAQEAMPSRDQAERLLLMTY